MEILAGAMPPRFPQISLRRNGRDISVIASMPQVRLPEAASIIPLNAAMDKEKWMVKAYSSEAVERAKRDALEWLEGRGHGYPRSWDAIAAHEERLGYTRYDDDGPPPILGYEALEREGQVIRHGVVVKSPSDERVHFELKSPPSN